MWQTKDGALYKEFEFKDFTEAFAFMTNVAGVADKMGHHPRWENEWNKVRIWLSTHSAGKVTDKDQALAEAIDALTTTSKQAANTPPKTVVKEIKMYGDGGSRGNPGHSAG